MEEMELLIEDRAAPWPEEGNDSNTNNNKNKKT